MKRIIYTLALIAICVAAINNAYAQDEITWHPEPTPRVEGNDIVVSWLPVPGASSYNVWVWDEVDGWQDLGWHKEFEYRHAGLAPGRKYWYTIRTISIFSRYGSAQIADPNATVTATAPATPTIATTTPTPTLVAGESTATATPTPTAPHAI